MTRPRPAAGTVPRPGRHPAVSGGESTFCPSSHGVHTAPENGGTQRSFRQGGLTEMARRCGEPRRGRRYSVSFVVYDTRGCGRPSAQPCRREQITLVR